MKPTILILSAVLAGAGLIDAVAAAQSQEAIRAIRAVGPEGRGNAEAAAAWKSLSAADGEALLTVLRGMEGATDLAVNWLRAAVDAIAGRELAAGRKLPVSDLESFVRDTKQHPRARRLAYELIARANPGSAQQLLAGLRDDSSPELRRDAIKRLTDDASGRATAGETNDAVAGYQSALKSARDVDQIEDIAKELKKLGHPVRLPDVFGWVTDWKVIGPFDNTGRNGHDKVFPPEERLDLAAEYEGKTGKIRWQDLKVTGDYGLVDLNKPCGTLKEVAGYAYAEFQAERARPVELRLGGKNAWKVWLNGRLLFGRDEYHRGAEIDQYRMPAELKPGKNTILVKICQNEQKESWTKEWEFQLRVTDALGTPIASAQP